MSNANTQGNGNDASEKRTLAAEAVRKMESMEQKIEELTKSMENLSKGQAESVQKVLFQLQTMESKYDHAQAKPAPDPTVVKKSTSSAGGGTEAGASTGRSTAGGGSKGVVGKKKSADKFFIYYYQEKIEGYEEMVKPEVEEQIWEAHNDTISKKKLDRTQRAEAAKHIYNHYKENDEEMFDLIASKFEEYKHS